MSSSTLSAIFTLGGLLIELVAVVLILGSVGVWDRWVAEAGRSAARVWDFVLRLWPWSEPKSRHRQASGRGVGRSSGRADGYVQKPTDRPTPASFEEVGDRLNELVEMWNRHEEKFVNRATKAREEVEAAEAEATRRHDETQEQLRSEAEVRLAERRREGMLFVFGVVLQVAGAVVLLG